MPVAGVCRRGFERQPAILSRLARQAASHRRPGSGRAATRAGPRL